MRSISFCAVLCLVSACGGGGGGDAASSGGGSGYGSPGNSSYTVGGTLSGLSGTVVLQDNAGNNLTLTANGAFAFSGLLANGATYSVTVLTEPSSQTCGVTNGTGTINSANVASVTVACSTTAQPTYTIGGLVSGLNGTVALQDNGGNNLTLTANGSFTFSAGLAGGTPYSVTVLTQPATQTCTVMNGSGSVENTNVTSVSIACSTNAYAVGGSVSGLSGSGLVLQLNGANALTVAAGTTSFKFPISIISGTVYAVTVKTQPSSPTQTCLVSNGAGTVTGSSVNDVAVACTTNSYSVGGTVSGLSGTGLTLQLNGGSDLPVAAGASSFLFPTSLGSGTNYIVTVKSEPNSPPQTCRITGGNGAIGSGNANSVAVACARFLYVGGTNTSGQANVFALSANALSGALSPVSGSPFPSFYLASGAVVDPSGRFLYLADGGVSGYAINPVSGALTPTPNSPYIAGDTPIALRVSPSGKYLYVANHYGYDISIFKIDPTTGSLTLSATVSLGSGPLEPWDLEINVAGTFLYVTSEDLSQAGSGILTSYIQMYSIDGNTGGLTPINGSPLSFSQVGIGPMAIRPGSSTAYVDVGGNILAYSINVSTGALTPLATSPILTNVTFEPFTFTPDGALVLAATVDFNTSARTIAVYRVDPNSGLWTQVPNSPFAAGAGADSILVEPTGRYIYLADASSIEVYALDTGTVSLTPIPGSPFALSGMGGNAGAFTTN